MGSNNNQHSIPEEASVILSTLHGRQRREERGISKAAFNAAVKYGEKSPVNIDTRTGEQRWLFNYKAGGISVITNQNCTEEVTSWAHHCWGLNVEKVAITKEMEDEHRQAVKDSVHHDTWNSHAVAVVDQSGSMRKTDAENGVTRSDLVWLSLAIDYVGRRLRTGEATNQDYFSLICMGPEAKCLIKSHPFNWILYNAIIEILRTRQPLGDGNYFPAISLAKRMLLSNRKGKCLHQLVFLTDGAPSDRAPPGSSSTIAYQIHAIRRHIASIAREFGSKLTIGAIAVGSGRYDALEAMILLAKDYSCHTYLKKSSLKAGDMSNAFSSMSTLISSSKSRATDAMTNCQRTYKNLIREPQSSVGIYDMDEEEWVQYTNVKSTVFDKYTRRWEPTDVFYDRSSVGVAVREYIFGEGRERAVRRVREVNAQGRFVGPLMVGKESLFVEDDSDSFHKTFCIVQQLAHQMAHRFNKQLLLIPGVDKKSTPTINFLDCVVMILVNNQLSSSAKFLLVEKMLDHTKYKKWNNNDGYVAEGRDQMLDKETQDSAFSVEDIPQAYSHFTYLASKRRFLICDLQGVLNTDVHPPVFELTDPAAHYSEMTNRKDYGRTDRGEQGIQDFFKTHKCSRLCHMLLHRWVDEPLDNDIIQYHNALDEKEPTLSSVVESGDVLMQQDDDEKPKPEKSVRFGRKS